MILLLRTPLRKFAFIIAIAVSTILLTVLTLPALGMAASFGTVKTVGDIATIPQSLPQLVLPQPALIFSLLLPAFSVAIIGLIQGAGVSQGTPNPDGKYPDVSRDFLGQGVANIATALVGGAPAGGSISGTMLLMSTGARSRWANIAAGLFVAVIVLLGHYSRRGPHQPARPGRGWEHLRDRVAALCHGAARPREQTDAGRRG